MQYREMILRAQEVKRADHKTKEKKEEPYLTVRTKTKLVRYFFCLYWSIECLPGGSPLNADHAYQTEYFFELFLFLHTLLTYTFLVLVLK